MRKLLLLSALLIFACSSDDDNNDNNSDETFLERYDGVVWQYDIESEDAPYLLAFYNNPEMFRRNNGISGNCDEFYFGIFNDEFGDGWGLLLNDGDTLTLEKFDFEGIAYKIHTIVVLDDVLTETITSYEDGSFIDEITCTRTTLTDPCD
tara:strand:+ start:676 stop:1125 length:450 start_codon:yes stop_codon:yes gene_type:complete